MQFELSGQHSLHRTRILYSHRSVKYPMAKAEGLLHPGHALHTRVPKRRRLPRREDVVK